MIHHILDLQGDVLTGKEGRDLFLVSFFTSLLSAGLGMAKCLQVGSCQTSLDEWWNNWGNVNKDPKGGSVSYPGSGRLPRRASCSKVPILIFSHLANGHPHLLKDPLL